MWTKTKTSSKAGFDKLYGLVDKLGPPVNRLSNKLGSEAFWPTTLDKESDKAARILKSFCKDGFYQEEERPTTEGPKSKQKVLKKIPTEVIKNAKALAIFTTMRTGLWFSGAGGSGILIGRTEDGTWSPPSGIMLHTAGLGFLAGIDIYDCVVVINTQQALDAFSKIRCTLGGEVSAVAGPVGVGGVLETEVHKRQAPVFTYMKSRGLYAGVQVDGTIIIERTDENERFYGERIAVGDILKGKARHPPYEIKRLHETIKAAQGDADFDESLIPSEPPPADYEIEAPTDKTFGVPDKEDPDPYGVLALQEAGLDIKEAGTHKRPTSEQFEFNPAPTSPIYSTFRRSFDRSSFDGRSVSRRSSWRTSTISSVLEPRTPSKMVDTSTQTDTDAPTSIQVPPPLPPRQTHTPSPTLANIPETKIIEDTPTRRSQENEEKHVDFTAQGTVRQSQAFDDVDLDGEVSDEEEPIIEEIHQAAAPQPITRARIVQVAKPIAPKLPPRNPFRNRGSYQSTTSNEEPFRDASTDPSPLAGQSPPATPSLKDGSSASSIDDFERLEHVNKELHPHTSHETQEQKEEKDDFHSLPESPTKAVPGGFH
ncbi:uncharacterized protein N0V89_002635 [Didymosphaeria variabile]|uniref:Ysc84 actin-binding domain-containing protein n=1 Tax=Didymosphaeria variabile TaxID=1932322 RepID=A0A9W9CDT0_9PLEO|nr:uncharacterized protein N0V89_002635 [Didymosphaeria variabile]KAJ4358056.1 hypothetical protein N0V89_002635 [Didymosphaeria variabile]